jgi:hypothetical protein
MHSSIEQVPNERSVKIEDVMQFIEQAYNAGVSLEEIKHTLASGMWSSFTPQDLLAQQLSDNSLDESRLHEVLKDIVDYLASEAALSETVFGDLYKMVFEKPSEDVLSSLPLNDNEYIHVGREIDPTGHAKQSVLLDGLITSEVSKHKSFISSSHLMIIHQGGKLLLQDLSTNGLEVNGAKVNRSVELHDGDSISLPNKATYRVSWKSGRLSLSWVNPNYIPLKTEEGPETENSRRIESQSLQLLPLLGEQIETYVKRLQEIPAEFREWFPVKTDLFELRELRDYVETEIRGLEELKRVFSNKDSLKKYQFYEETPVEIVGPNGRPYIHHYAKQPLSESEVLEMIEKADSVLEAL